VDRLWIGGKQLRIKSELLKPDPFWTPLRDSGPFAYREPTRVRVLALASRVINHASHLTRCSASRGGEIGTPPNRYPAVRQAVHAQGGGGRHARLHRGARRRRHGLQGALRRRPCRHRRQAPPRRRPPPGRGRRDHERILPGAAAAGPPQPSPRRQAARLRASPPRKARALPPSDPFFLPSPPLSVSASADW
jgi:hypothetical protein